ncbi:hypothetical protein JS756_28905 [Streptomyces actuosus]|uniref:von Hippel-Lindau disease tumour suppressor beta domain-containing protein n=1 Tax=Streptomyces actuosus TaxID=1885 RepID=A0ABS2VY51_STRAS|nr:hypothetical protein [Streptomyces actuosus]
MWAAKAESPPGRGPRVTRTSRHLRRNTARSASRRTPLPSSEAEDLRSVESRQSTYIEFINVSGVRLRVFWIDYDQKPVLYATLVDGDSYVQQTFVTHPWAAVTDAGEIRAAYLPSSSPARAVLR